MASGSSELTIRGTRKKREFFASKREAVVWAVLGGTLPKRTLPCVCYCFDKSNTNYSSRKFEEMISEMDREDKIWMIQQIVRLASEFAQCCFVGKSLYENFVVGDEEADYMLSTPSARGLRFGNAFKEKRTLNLKILIHHERFIDGSDRGKRFLNK